MKVDSPRYGRPMWAEQVEFARLVPRRWIPAHDVGCLYETATGKALSMETLSGRIRRLVGRGALESRYVGPRRAVEVRRIVSVRELEKL